MSFLIELKELARKNRSSLKRFDKKFFGISHLMYFLKIIFNINLNEKLMKKICKFLEYYTCHQEILKTINK